MIPMVLEHRTSGLSLAGCRNFQLYSAALRVLIVVVPVNKWMEFWKVLWNDGSFSARNGFIVAGRPKVFGVKRGNDTSTQLVAGVDIRIENAGSWLGSASFATNPRTWDSSGEDLSSKKSIRSD
jgi:hypothetical protein